MRAVVYEERGRVRVADVPDPAIEEPTDALVRVTRAGICGSDLHFLQGKAPLDPGSVMGHEATGVLEAVGDRVVRRRPGERVVASFVIACGECWFCARGHSSLCEDVRYLGAGPFGGDLPGAQAQMLRVPHADVNLLALPADIDDDRAVFLGDALTTGVYAAGVADVARGMSVAIVGAGPVGVFCAQAVRAASGGTPVFLVDREPRRLEAAVRVGAVPVDPASRHPVSAIADATGGRGADVVIDAVGSSEAFELSLDSVRRGGTVLVVGMYAGEEVPLQLGASWARGITIRFAGSTPVHAWWERALAAVVAGRIDPAEVVSHRLPLDEAAEGYRLFAAREASKVVLVP
jgi:2-desacetyl-2-hydroxyethyl bacteriochlorophyllide A dehydrogenase